MSLIIKIVISVLFIAAYASYFWTANYLMQRLKGNLSLSGSFWFSGLTSGLMTGSFLLFIFLLSGFFSLPLLLILIAAQAVSFAAGAVLWGFLGSPTSKWSAHSAFAGEELGLKNTYLMLGVIVLSFILVLGYPLAALFAFFSHTLPSPDLTTLIFQYTLLYIIINYLWLVPIIVGVISSPNLDEDTRNRFFITQLSSLLTEALYLALALWAFGVREKGIDFAIGGIPLTFSLRTVLALITFFVLVVLLPYLIGAQQGKKWQLNLKEEEMTWLNRVLDIINSPSASLYVSKLNQLQAELQAKVAEFKRNDRMVDLGTRIDEVGGIPKELAMPAKNATLLVNSYRESRELDPRFTYLDWLSRFAGGLTELSGDLGSHHTEDEWKKAAETWVSHYAKEKELLGTDIEAAKGSRPTVVIGVMSLLGIISAPILNALANWAGQILTQSLPK